MQEEYKRDEIRMDRCQIHNETPDSNDKIISNTESIGYLCHTGMDDE